MLSQLTPPNNKSIAYKSPPATSHTAHAPVPCPQANQRSGRLTAAFMEALKNAHPANTVSSEIMDLLEGLEQSPFYFGIINDTERGIVIQAIFRILHDISEIGGSKHLSTSIQEFLPKNNSPDGLTTFLQNRDFLTVLHGLGKAVTATYQDIANSLPAEQRRQTGIDEMLTRLVSPFIGNEGTPHERMNTLYEYIMARERFEEQFEKSFDNQDNGKLVEICNWLKRRLKMFGV